MLYITYKILILHYIIDLQMLTKQLQIINIQQKFHIIILLQPQVIILVF